MTILLFHNSMFSYSPIWWVSFFSFSLQTSLLIMTSLSLVRKRSKRYNLKVAIWLINLLSPTFYLVTMEEVSCFLFKVSPSFVPWISFPQHFHATITLLSHLLSVSLTLLEGINFSFISIQRNLRISYPNHFLFLYSPFK